MLPTSDFPLMAVGRRSEDVIELWNLEDGKDPRRFAYPHEKLSILRFSPTSDTLMAASSEKLCHIYLWRLDTQEMVSFSHDFSYTLHVIHSPLTYYLFFERFRSGDMECLYDRLKNDLGEASNHFRCMEYLSITRWPQAFSWIY